MNEKQVLIGIAVLGGLALLSTPPKTAGVTFKYPTGSSDEVYPKPSAAWKMAISKDPTRNADAAWPKPTGGWMPNQPAEQEFASHFEKGIRHNNYRIEGQMSGNPLHRHNFEINANTMPASYEEAYRVSGTSSADSISGLNASGVWPKPVGGFRIGHGVPSDATLQQSTNWDTQFNFRDGFRNWHVGGMI